jgi:hypothetical protein
VRFTCPAGSTQIVTQPVTGHQSPACTSGQGAWVEEQVGVLEQEISVASMEALFPACLLALLVAFGVGEIRRLLR